MHAHRGQAFQGVTPSFHLSNYQLSKQRYFVVCPLTFYRQRTSRTVPEWIAALTFTFGVGHKGRDQLQNILFLVDICERIVAHGLVKIYGVHRPDFISVLQQGKAAFLNETAFGVSYHE